MNANPKQLGFLSLLLALLFLSACSQVSPAPAVLESQALIIVQNTNDSGLGSLREAVEIATSGSTIRFDERIAGGTITLATQLVVSGKTLTIEGPASGMTISGGGVTRVFRVANSANLTLRNLRLEKGFRPPDGDFIAINGGAIFADASSIILENSTIWESSAVNGGGIFAIESNVQVISSTIAGNRAGYGGGIFAYDSNVHMTNSTLSGNIAVNWGGGIYIDGVDMDFGNGVYLTSSTVALNEANIGSGLYSRLARVEFVNSIFARNVLSSAICAFGGGSTIFRAGSNLAYDESCLDRLVQGDVIDYPLLGSLANNGGPTMTHALLTGSPAIDAAPCLDDVATDQRGVRRPQGETCDFGAYEYTAVSVSINDRGSVNATTGAATVSGSLTCSGPSQVNLQVRLEQEQKARRVSTVVQASGTTTVGCTGSSPATWSITLQPSSGAFHNNTATASAETLNSDAASATSRGVRLSWAR